VTSKEGAGSTGGASGELWDVVIVGGGPGGSVAAARLALLGVRPLVLEKAHHPRFHLGESLLPQSMATLRAIGVLEAVQARFLVKRGAHFHDDREGGAPGGARSVRYDFADAYEASFPYAFEVPRDEFDELLFRHAQSLGAETREGVTVDRVVFEGERAVGVDVTKEDGSKGRIGARFVIDASGRDALLAHAQRGTSRVPCLDKTALFSQWRGAFRDRGDREGDIQIVVIPSGWFWFIPFADGRTSVGVVQSSAWMKGRRQGETPQDLYLRAIAESPVASRFLEHAEQLWPAGATADFSFRVRTLSGPGWLTLGDAGGFIDPLFSTGAHLAIRGGALAAEAVAYALTVDADDRAPFETWERFVRLGTDTFLGAVQAFYDGPLRTYLFAERQHIYLRRAITSMLSGDVFDEDARWVRDMRSRFPARLSDAS
jgi:flavin-dependent dehydrogenase